jgi:hypothetical protein
VSASMILGVKRTLPVGLTVKELKGTRGARKLILYAADVDVLVVSTALDGLVVDGGPVPEIEARPFKAAGMPFVVDLEARVFLGIAAEGPGELELEVR